jgi:hypothetical protein
MINDINIIKNELKSLYEVKMPFNFTNDSIIKYITIKDNKEFFYKGGKFKNIGNQKIFLYNVSNTWAVPINYKDKKGNIYYTTRFFVEEEKKNKDSDEIKELKSIIENQQNIINKMTLKIKNLTIINNKLTSN